MLNPTPQTTYLNDYRLQRRPKESASLAKTLTMKEHYRIDFRAEFFNLFNHTNFINPFSSSSAGYTDGSRGAALNGAGFGTLKASRDPRIGQLALKIIF